MTRIGVISDTHGLLRNEAVEALEGCDRIFHAGDIGSMAIVPALGRIAPVTAIRGNVDTAPWSRSYGAEETVEIDGCRIFMIHDLQAMTSDPVKEGVRVVIYGHSHLPKEETKDGVLYLNPGSAGVRRFKLPVSVARLDIDGSEVRSEIVHLDV